MALDLIWIALESFIRTETTMRPGRIIHYDDSLETGLDLVGIDAYRFMSKFFTRFDVDAGDYEFDHYFSDEGFDVYAIIEMLMLQKKRQIREKAPLTVGMLARAIQAGKWNSASLDRWHLLDEVK